MQRVRKQIEVPEELVKGRAVIVAVLDSGIGKHPDLENKVLCFKDFVGRKSQMYDDSGHGTHICGIICGSGRMSAGQFKGIAPTAKLIVGKVLDAEGNGNAEHMLEALEWIEELQKRYQIQILNISVGIGNLTDIEKEISLQRKLEKLWEQGIFVVCAAGNKGPANGSISSIGGSGKIITVGCHDGKYCRENPQRCELYSGRGNQLSGVHKPDLVAPGTDIVSCNNSYKWHDGRFQDLYAKKSGTSMATPIIAGAAALAFQRFPDMTNEELKRKIVMTASDLGEPWNKQGWGMVNVRRLLN